jgi:uncharacterized membrane protein
MSDYRIWSLIVIKLLILLVVYWNYRSIRSSGHSYSRRLWDFSKVCISFLGLVLVINNLMVTFVRLSLFEYLGFS